MNERKMSHHSQVGRAPSNLEHIADILSVMCIHLVTELAFSMARAEELHEVEQTNDPVA